jgi:hypothetical protein
VIAIVDPALAVCVDQQIGARLAHPERKHDASRINQAHHRQQFSS